MKTQVENEKKMIALSTNIDQNQDLLAGKTVTNKSIVKINGASGEKEYVFPLKKYELVNPVTNKVSSNRYIILKIQPREEAETGVTSFIITPSNLMAAGAGNGSRGLLSSPPRIRRTAAGFAAKTNQRRRNPMKKIA